MQGHGRDTHFLSFIVDRDFLGEGAGAPRVTVESRPGSADGHTIAPFLGVISVTVGTGDDKKTCDTEISFFPH